MPLYNYLCEQCEAEFIELRRISEMDDLNDCPECGKDSNRRLLSGFALGTTATTHVPVSPQTRSPFR